jgi:hypothetical protein
MELSRAAETVESTSPRLSPKLALEMVMPQTSQSASDDLLKEMDEELICLEERGNEPPVERIDWMARRTKETGRRTAF